MKHQCHTSHSTLSAVNASDGVQKPFLLGADVHMLLRCVTPVHAQCLFTIQINPKGKVAYRCYVESRIRLAARRSDRETQQAGGEIQPPEIRDVTLNVIDVKSTQSSNQPGSQYYLA